MTRWFAGSVADDEQLLSIFYDAQRKAAALGWVTRKPKFPPLSHSLHFELTFTRKGSSLNETWGSQPFQIQKRADAYTFTHAFNGLTDSDRFLRDLAWAVHPMRLQSCANAHRRLWNTILPTACRNNRSHPHRPLLGPQGLGDGGRQASRHQKGARGLGAQARRHPPPHVDRWH